MGRFNVSLLRYLGKDDFRTLSAIEMGMKNHEFVPLQLCCSIAKIKGSGMKKKLGELIRHALIAYEKSGKTEGYRLTALGYDFLALNALRAEGAITSVGNQIGVGKESDVYLAQTEDGTEVVIKLHRLGRTSFRRIKEKRDYHGKRRSPNWLYLSRLSALKEFAFMKALSETEPPLPVPTPIAHSRHAVVMSVVAGVPLARVAEVPDVGELHNTLMELLVRLANLGLIHSDFNEFNILLNDADAAPVLIDFPQMVSTSHRNAEWYFDRDVTCLREFFKRRFGFEATEWPTFADVEGEGELDVETAASGFVRAALGEDYESEEEERADSSFSDSDPDEAPQAVPMDAPTKTPGSERIEAWVAAVPDVPEASEAIAMAEEPTTTSPIADEDVADSGDSGDDEGSDIAPLSIISRSTIHPEEIRSRLKKQVGKQQHSSDLKGALKKNLKHSSRQMRKENKIEAREVDGWL